jgi:hypothetical protein
MMIMMMMMLITSLSILLGHISGVEVLFHSFLTSAVDGGEWLTSRFGRLTTGKEAMCPLNRRLGGPPQSRSGGFWRKKFRTPTGIRIRDHTDHSSISVLTTNNNNLRPSSSCGVQLMYRAHFVYCGSSSEQQ